MSGKLSSSPPSIDDEPLRLSCRGCRHFFITYEPQNPWGCRKFGFKGKNLPAQIVYQATGMQCAYFSGNASMKKSQAGRRNKRSGILDIKG